MKYHKFSTSAAGLLLGSIALAATSVAPGLASDILRNKSNTSDENVFDSELNVDWCMPCPDPSKLFCWCYKSPNIE